MKKAYRFIALTLLAAFLSGFVPAPVRAADDDYDPMNTMLALNMAIVSVHRIVTTQDRIVLDQEYNTIINRLALGNIEADIDMTGLYEELMNFISGKALRQEEARRFQERYNRREQRQLVDSLSNIRAYGGSLWSWLGSLATSCISTYFGYQSAKAELLEGLDDELWQLKREDVEDCNDLQTRLLTSSWNLLRQYKLPDDYRLTQDSLNSFHKTTQEPAPAKRLRMLRAIERSFRVYPPYWFYRANAAREANDDAETRRCFDKFDEIWRPVLRLDPYKLEAAKWRIQDLAKNGAPSGEAKEEIKRQLALMREYTPDGDWGNNLFAGVAYFALGERDEAVMCVEPNVDFGYETAVSGAILTQMKAGKLNPETLSGELRALFEDLTRKETEESNKKTARKIEELNPTYGGKCLGDVFTAEQSAAIRAGTFDGMALGDYWTINDVNWRIADFDYLIRSGSVDASKHHVMIIPDKKLYNHRMNNRDTTSGGYGGSEMRASGLNRAKDIIGRAFGREHILSDYGVELMTEKMIFGNGDNTFSLFRVHSGARATGSWYWLQDVVSSAYFAAVGSYGLAYYTNASNTGGVRPAFAIY